MAEKLIVTKDALQVAAQELAEAISAADRELGWTRIAVSGGSAGDVLGLVRPLLKNGEWARLRLTWIDERCVDFASPDSNRGTLYRKGILSKEYPTARELPLWEDGDTPERAIARFSKRFEADFSSGLDVALLGLGEDGHIASLFPGHKARFSLAPLAYLDDSPKPPPRRVTMTLKSLRTSRINVMYAAGAAKKAAIEQILSGDTLAPANALPGDLVIVTDQPVEKKS